MNESKISSKSVSVIILNYNGFKFIKPCVRSVMAQDYDGVEIIVIDNDSTDNSLGLVRSISKDIRVVANEQNIGFARAMNQGIDISSGEFIITLNVDVTLEPDFISKLTAAAHKDERIGSASGKVYRMDRTEPRTIDTTGHIIFKNRLFTDRGESRPDLGQFDREEDIFGACAGAGFYRRAMLEDIKIGSEYFDADFFMFLEDTDLSWRAQLRGWRCRYVPDAVAYHHRGAAAVKGSKLVETHSYKNRYFMILKNDTCLGVMKSLPDFLITDTLKSGALLRRRPSALLGWGSVFKNIPNMLKKRKMIQRRRLISRRQFEREWLVPFDYKSWFGKRMMDKK